MRVAFCARFVTTRIVHQLGLAQITVGQDRLVADDGHLADLLQGIPTHVNVSQHPLAKVKGDKSHVFQPRLQVCGSDCQHAPGEPAEQGRQNIGVVNKRVPNDVGVEPGGTAHAGADAMDVAQLSHLSLLDQADEAGHGRVIQKQMPHHQGALYLFRQTDQRLRLLAGDRQRLFHVHVFAGPQARFGNGAMALSGGSNRHRLYRRVVEYIFQFERGPHPVLPGDAAESFQVQITHRRQLAAGQGGKITNEVGAPIASPDDGNVNRHDA